jgi:hypothetical protein
VSGPAAEVQYPGAGGEPFGQTGHRGQETGLQMLVVDAPPHVVHVIGELRAERRVRDAAAAVEAPLQLR